MGTLHAQTLTLQDCIQKALHTHPDIKRFILQIRHGKREIDVAQADYLPQISLNAEYDPTRTYVLPANNIFLTQNNDGWDRWLDKVYLPSCNGLKLDHMYEAMDFLNDNIEEVEEAIFNNTADLFNLDVDLIFYDATTASFSIDYEDDDYESPECRAGRAETNRKKRLS